MTKKKKNASSEKATKSPPENSSSKKAQPATRKWLMPLLLVVALLGLLGVGYSYRDSIKNTLAGNEYRVPTTITKEEMEMLVSDFPPQQLKMFSENPEQKTQLIDNLRELLAIANEAQREGFADDPEVRQELESAAKNLLAMGYDRKINPSEEPKPPFSAITEDQIKQFWESPDSESNFQTYINRRLAAARKRGQVKPDQEPSEEELKQAREAFSRSGIYYLEAKNKLADIASLPEEERQDWEKFKKKIDVQIKLQTAQILTQKYAADVLNKKFEVTDAEVKEYLEANPELTNSEEKKKKAEEILEKVKNGGDFAKLADEFSEDPGTKGKGGLYKGVTKGQFAPEFEVAALAMKPGEYTDELVKTNFGYHIIKLVKKGEGKGNDGKVAETYDARHILVSTMVKDPENPTARGVPAEQYVKSKLEKEKQKSVIDDIKARNPVNIAEDFEIPTLSAEQIEEMEKKQMEKMGNLQIPVNAPKADKNKPKKK